MLTDLDYELLSAYIDGTLSEAERTAFEARLRAEPELSRELDEMRATVTLLNNLPALKAPRNFTLDARYARRQSFYLTTAFSAISTAAAIMLFALGAYLFTGDQNAPAANTSTGAAAPQAGQLAFVPTSTRATTLDKSSAETATEIVADAVEANVIGATGTAANSLSSEAGLSTLTEKSGTNEEPAPVQAPLFQPDNTQLTELPSDGAVAGGFPFESTLPADLETQEQQDTQNRGSDATETYAVQQQQYAPSSSNSGDAVPVAPSSPMIAATPDVASGSASSAFAATVAPTEMPTATETQAPTSTNTEVPTATITATSTQLPTPTATVTPAPIIPETQPASDSLPIVLMGFAVVLLIVGVITTIIRRRNRL